MPGLAFARRANQGWIRAVSGHDALTSLAKALSALWGPFPTEWDPDLRAAPCSPSLGCLFTVLTPPNVRPATLQFRHPRGVKTVSPQKMQPFFAALPPPFNEVRC